MRALGALALVVLTALAPSLAQAQTCEEGRVLSNGRCCWPGQRFDEEDAVCAGPPQCPRGLVDEGGACRPGRTLAPEQPRQQGPALLDLGEPRIGSPNVVSFDRMRGTSFARNPGGRDEDDGPGFDEGLVIAGSVTLGAGFLAGAILGGLTAEGWPFLPVLGPFLWPITNIGIGLAAGLPLGVVQTVGFILLVVGLADTHRPAREQQRARVTSGPGELGVGFAVDF